MKNMRYLLLIAMVTTMHSALLGQNVRLSFKVILSPTTGNRPAYATDALINDAMDYMNTTMAQYNRGITFSRESVIEVGGIGQPISAAFYNSTNKDALEIFAEANVAASAWRSTRINIYLNNGALSGRCSFPGEEVILIGRNLSRLSTFLHEIGHFFNLCHTQGCPCASCDANQTGVCHTVPGSDGVSDTHPDLSCWNQDDIAQNAYNSNYTSLTFAQQDRVDDVWFNVMSYHANRSRLTSAQLNRWIQAIFDNPDRQDVVSTLPIYVDVDANCSSGCSASSCPGTAFLPTETFLCGMSKVSSSRRLLVIDGGVYNEISSSTILSSPVLIVGTEGNDAIIR